jgi:hypothetical protein
MLYKRAAGRIFQESPAAERNRSTTKMRFVIADGVTATDEISETTDFVSSPN